MGPIVETTSGKVEGRTTNGVSAFLGIPYAEPVSGARRFARPAPRAPWAGVRAALDYGFAPPQHARGFVSEATGENCLVLNVWTPSPSPGRRPVMVWIPGGGFNMGSGADPRYDSSELARRGEVVVVTINYRVGLLGFLYLAPFAEGIDWSANAGLLDQVAALEWVRDNIAAFGGDADNVTIFGESAGGMAVADLLVVPRAEGLFRRAIAQSGAADDVAEVDEAERLARLVFDFLGIPQGDAAQLLEVPIERLLEAQDHCQSEYFGHRWGLSTRPVLDGEVLPDHPRRLVAKGASSEVALLVGTTLDEWRRFGDEASFALEEGSLRRCLRESCGEGSEELLEGYRALRPRDTPSDLWFAIESDRNFRIPAIWLTEAHAGQGARTYAFLFTWRSPVERLRSCHAIDVPFVFGTLDAPGMAEFTGDSPAARALSRTVQDAWLAFARDGVPAAPGLEAWPCYEEATRSTMIFDDPPHLLAAPYEGERRLWELRSLRPFAASSRELHARVAR